MSTARITIAKGRSGRHVLSLTIRTGAGDVVRCSAKEHDDLFRATIGGMGLTGAILDLTLRLVRVPSTAILEECERVQDIDQSLDALKVGKRSVADDGGMDRLSGERTPPGAGRRLSRAMGRAA